MVGVAALPPLAGRCARAVQPHLRSSTACACGPTTRCRCCGCPGSSPHPGSALALPHSPCSRFAAGWPPPGAGPARRVPAARVRLPGRDRQPGCCGGRAGSSRRRARPDRADRRRAAVGIPWTGTPPDAGLCASRPSSSTIFLVAAFAGQSLPLRHHQEHSSSFEAVQRIADAAAGRQGVFLWQQSRGCMTSRTRSAAGLAAAGTGQLLPLLPERPDAAYVRLLSRWLPRPTGVPGRRRQPRAATRACACARRPLHLPHAGVEETYLTRPSKAVVVPIPISISRVEGT